MIFINGIMASKEDLELLKKRIFDENAICHSATKDNFGNQYIEID